MSKETNNEELILREFLKKINPVTEFEARFGLEIREFGYQNNKISRSKFTKILKYFRDNFPGMVVTDNLDMFFWENNRNQNKIRVTINNMEAIQKYCRDEKINWNSSDINLVYKDKMYWSPSELDDLINKKGIWTENIIENGRATHRKRDLAVFDSDFQYRIGLKQEIPIIYNSEKDSFSIKRGYKTHLTKNFKNLKMIERNLELFNSLKNTKCLKTFRYKKRWSFKSPDNLFRFDFTVLKSGKKDGRFVKPSKSFRNARVLEQPENFEIEIEYIGDSKISNEKQIKEISDSFHNSVNLMMSKIQNSVIPISMSEKNDVLKEYREMILTNYVRNIQNQIYDIEEDIKYLPEDTEIDKKTIKKLEKLKKALKMYTIRNKEESGIVVINPNFSIKRCWVGPKPITLEKDNLGASPDSINKNYSVTDKADGERTLLFVNSKGYAYFITNNMNVKPVILNKTKLRLLDNYMILIDGEFIETDKYDREYNRFMAFDIYFANDKVIYDYKLKDKNERRFLNRYDILVDFFGEISKKYNADISETENPLESKLWYKKFYFSETEGDIFKLAEECYNTASNDPKGYHIDGLIFTPSNLGVGFINPSMSHKDEEYKYNSISGTWKKTFKWKPLSEQSIDFYVEVEKDKFGKPVISHKQLIVDGKEQVVRYKRLNLYVGINQLDKKIKMIGNPCSNITPLVNTGSSNFITKMPFTPSYFWYKEISQAWVPISEKGEFLTAKNVDEGKIITGSPVYTHIADKSVVEFVYDKKSPLEFRWKILRVREDKTELLEEALNQREEIFSNYQRNLDLIKDVVKIDEKNITFKDKTNINNLTKRSYLLFKALNVPNRGSYYNRLMSIKKVLLDGDSLSIKQSDNIPIQFNYGNFYITAENVWTAINDPITNENMFGTDEIVFADGDKYYKNVGRREDSLTYNLQVYHNRYIKKSLIWAAADLAREKTSDVTLLDLCCGKGGDLFKWEDAKINKVLGIDFSKDNIYNRENGACVRYMNLQKRRMFNDKMIDVDFLVGDCGKSIKNLEAFFKDLRSEQHYRDNYLMKDGTPMKFNVVSCQFAIHYFMSSIDSIMQFIDNVDEHLESGGIFIGTCLDGGYVYNKLCENYKKTGERKYVTRDDKNNEIWSIKANFDCNSESFFRVDPPTGFDIEIELPSITGIGESYHESLVNFDFLVHLFKMRGFQLVKKTKNNLKGSDLFDNLYRKYIKKEDSLKLSMAEKELSFLYRYFIFKKM